MSLKVIIALVSLSFLFLCIVMYQYGGNGSLRVLVGTRSQALFKEEAAYLKSGWTTLSADKIRDEEVEKDGTWNEKRVQAKLFWRIAKNVFLGKKVAISTSANSYRYFWLLDFLAYDFKVIDVRQDKALTIFEWREMSDTDVLKLTPLYFQKHQYIIFARYAEGPKRARVIMLEELDHYSDSRFAGSKLAWQNK